MDIGAEPGGLNADNVRDMVIEVRKKVPTLVVDGNRPEGRGQTGDLGLLKTFPRASSIYEVEELKLEDLEKADLDLYPSIVLLNVAEVPPAAVARLKKYVENGGSLCYFLGDEVRPDHYNTVLFKNGLFSLLLKDRPFDPVYAADFKDPEERKRRTKDSHPKILFPNPKHPLVERVARFQPFFRAATSPGRPPRAASGP